MSYAIDVQALRERAANRVAKVANAANRLTEPEPISQLATLATSHAQGLRDALRRSVMTEQQADACHAGGWTDAEIQAFNGRRDRLLRWGYAEQQADDLAERLTLRDREQDDRHACMECRHGRALRCPDGIPLPGDLLHRCAGFSENGK